MTFKKGNIPWNKGKKFPDSIRGENHPLHGRTVPDEIKRKISDSMKGKKHSEETKRKLSESRMGKNNPMYGKTPWNKGLPTEEIKRRRGNKPKPPISEETRLKMSLAQRGEKSHMFGKTLSEETKQKIREAKIGNKNPMYGKPSWNTGLTKEDHPSLKIISDKLSGRVMDEEWRNKMSLAKIGDKHPFWNGGSSILPYPKEFNHRLKKQIRVRDNLTCQICNEKQKELNRKLDCHHIDYDKTNNDPKNLISLCNKCHLTTNHNRSYWEKLLSNKIKIMYG